MSKLTEPDTVYIGALSHETRKAFEDAFGWEHYEADRTWLNFDECCAMWFRLKFAPDDPEVFPKGKWATLQRFEELIEQATKPFAEREGYAKTGSPLSGRS